MTRLSAEAYAIIEGRHSDPFHYLGLHAEGDKSVVRAFLPEASKVEAIGEHGETAPLKRIHDSGLFAGATTSTGSKIYSSFPYDNGLGTAGKIGRASCRERVCLVV